MDNNTNQNIYIKILIVLFLINSVIAIGVSAVKQRLGSNYVFHSWLNVTYLMAWVLMIGLILIITFTYLSAWLGGILVPLVLGLTLFWGNTGYSKEIKQGQYIVTETQQLGEKVIRYYEDINVFIMKMHHEEFVR